MSPPPAFDPAVDAPVRCGVVGLGYWGPNLLRCLSQIPDTEVSWICDLDGERLERFGRQYPAVGRTSDISDLLEDPDLDAIIIATPVRTHFELAMRSLDAGKHTFVEKPLAPSRELADTLLAKADDAGLALMCGHTFIFSPAVRKVKELVDRRELGELFFVSSSRVNLGLHQQDVSVVWDLGPHDFSILLYLLDEMPTRVAAFGRDSIVPGIPDVAFVNLTFPSGIIANVELGWLAPSKLRRTVLVGREKMVVYEDGGPEPIKIFDHGVVYKDPETFGEYHLSYRTGDVLVPKLETYEPLAREMAEFARFVREGTSSWHAELARNVVAITEAADLSLRSGGIKIELETERHEALDGRFVRLS